MRPEMQNVVELDLTTWREEPVPALWSEKWREANQGRECYVFEHDDKLILITGPAVQWNSVLPMAVLMA